LIIRAEAVSQVIDHDRFAAGDFFEAAEGARKTGLDMGGKNVYKLPVNRSPKYALR
jgi:hypothetical protein